MKLKMVLALTISIGALTGCVSGGGESRDSASTANQGGGASSNLPENEGNKRICKVERITGSHRRQKVCMTAKEWEKVSSKSSEMISEQTRKGGLRDPVRK